MSSSSSREGKRSRSSGGGSKRRSSASAELRKDNPLWMKSDFICRCGHDCALRGKVAVGCVGGHDRDLCVWEGGGGSCGRAAVICMGGQAAGTAATFVWEGGGDLYGAGALFI